MSDKIEFDTGLRLLFEALIGGVHTAFPGIVQAYNSATMRATVQPCLMKKYYQDPAPIPLPLLQDVPVLFASTGSLHIIAPPDTGSYVLVICSERSLDMWLTSGGIVDPENPRKFDISDAIAIPGLFPLPNVLAPPAVPGTIEIRNSVGTCILCITPTEIQLQCGNAIPPVDYAVKFDQLKIAFDKLKADTKTFIETIYNLHNHPTAPTGPVSTPSVVGIGSTADMSLAKVVNVRLP